MLWIGIACSDSNDELFYNIYVTKTNRGETWSCSCPHNSNRHIRCKHIDVLDYCARRNFLPYGYSLTEDGMLFYKVSFEIENNRRQIDEIKKEMAKHARYVYAGQRKLKF